MYLILHDNDQMCIRDSIKPYAISLVNGFMIKHSLVAPFFTNPRPVSYTHLEVYKRQLKMVPGLGIEPRTRGFSIPCSTVGAIRATGRIKSYAFSIVSGFMIKHSLVAPFFTNPRPVSYTHLEVYKRQLKMVPGLGIEPRTRGFSIPCSTVGAIRATGRIKSYAFSIVSGFMIKHSLVAPFFTNPRPVSYTHLEVYKRQLKMVPGLGIEPRTRGFSIPCSTD